MLEKQASLTRSKAPSFVQSKLGESILGSCDSLEETWSIVRDIQAKMDKIREGVEDGVPERIKELNNSIIEKDNEVLKLMSEHDSKMRELKQELRQEIQELKRKHKAELTELNQEREQLKNEKVEMLSRLTSLEYEKQNNILNQQRVKNLGEQNRLLQEDIEKSQGVMSVTHGVIETLSKQIEEKELKKADFEDKYRDLKLKSRDSKERILRTFQLVLRSFKKKATEKDVAEHIEKLPQDEQKVILSILDDVKIAFKKK